MPARTFLLLMLIGNLNGRFKLEKCYECGKEPLSKNEIGICKKLLGKRATKYFCIDCLANQLEVSSEELIDKIEEFKNEGCTLFE